MPKQTTEAVKRPWNIGNVLIAAKDEREAKRIYREEFEPKARSIKAALFEGPYMLCENEDEPEYETDEQGFVNFLVCCGGWYSG